MTILTSSLIELQSELLAKREFLAKDRPTSQSKKRKWREIEDAKDDRELARLESNTIEIG